MKNIKIEHETIVSNGKALAHITGAENGELGRMLAAYNFCEGVTLSVLKDKVLKQMIHDIIIDYRKDNCMSMCPALMELGQKLG